MSAFENVSFPLAMDKVPQIRVSPQDVATYRAIASELVYQTVEQDHVYRHFDNEELDPLMWKYVKSKGDLKSYKRINKGPDGKDEKYVKVPMIVVVGTIEGTLENTLYGIHNKTTEDIRIMASFTNKNLLDTALLNTIESGSDADPYRFMGLKWRAAQTPGGNLIKNRDVTNLEFMGIDYDSRGEKYAFHMLKSIDLPDFPAFTGSNIIRSRMMLCCIFRQISPTVVGCYCKGVFDLGGALLDIIAYNTASDTVLAMAKAADCANIKRLTLLLMRTEVGIGRERVDTKFSSVPRLFSRSSVTSTDSMSLSGLELLDDMCGVCNLRQAGRGLLRSSYASCVICHRRTCSKCSIKQKFLARPKHFKALCCISCVLEAKNMDVDPRDPYPILNNGFLYTR